MQNKRRRPTAIFPLKIYEFINDITKSINAFKKSYSLLCKLLPQLEKEYEYCEIRALADCITFKLAKYYLRLSQIKEINIIFGIHHSIFKKSNTLITKDVEYMVIP